MDTWSNREPRRIRLPEQGMALRRPNHGPAEVREERRADMIEYRVWASAHAGRMIWHD